MARACRLAPAATCLHRAAAGDRGAASSPTRSPCSTACSAGTSRPPEWSPPDELSPDLRDHVQPARGDARALRDGAGRHEAVPSGRRTRCSSTAQDREPRRLAQRRSPIDSDLMLGRFRARRRRPTSTRRSPRPHAAFPRWRALPVAERAAAMRRVGDLMEERVYEIAAALTLEVGKNRMEALGEAQETVDFFHYYADDFEAHAGYELALPNDPLDGVVSRNRSVMRPHGVWVVIAPFNFPLALAGGPVAAALVTGNTVVRQGRERHAVVGAPARRLHPRCRPAAGRLQLPVGVGAAVGEALVRDPLTAGITFTGSLGVGMQHAAADGRRRDSAALHRRDGRQESVHRHRARRPRSRRRRHRALGLRHGRAEVLGAVAAVRARERRRRTDRRGSQEQIDAIQHRRCAQARALAGPGGQRERLRQLRAVRRRAARGQAARSAAVAASCATATLARGYYVEPVLAEAALAHPLWKQEMFLPIVMLHRYRDRDEAMRLANDTDMGLTAGFYGVGRGVRLVPRPHRGRRHLRQPPAGCDHRRLARLPAVRRLEGLGLDRQGDRLVLLPAAVPARAVAHGGGVSHRWRSCR